MKRSKLFKIKNQSLSEDTAFEREFKLALVHKERESKDTKFVLLVSILVMFFISAWTESPIIEKLGELMVLAFGIYGIVL